MSDIDYKEKYEAMAHWASKVIVQSNELYETVTEQIVSLMGENKELREALEKEKEINAL